MKIIDLKLLEEISVKAASSARKRTNFNFHEAFSDPINRMLNAIEPGSYVQPHKHVNPVKREVFILLKGKLAIVFFDDKGTVTESVILDSDQNFGVEIPPGVWHTIFSLQKGTVVYEVKDGPYSVDDDKNFAEWAPKENSVESKTYLQDLLKKLDLNS